MVRQRRRKERTDRLIVIAPTCPKCGDRHLDADGPRQEDHRFIYRPLVCRRCGLRVEYRSYRRRGPARSCMGGAPYGA